MSEITYSSKNLMAWWRTPNVTEVETPAISKFHVARSVGNIALPRSAEAVLESRGFTAVWDDRIPQDIIQIPDVRICALVCRENADRRITNIMRRVIEAKQRAIFRDIRFLLAPEGSQLTINDLVPEHTGILYVTPEISLTGDIPKLWIPKELSRG